MGEPRMAMRMVAVGALAALAACSTQVEAPVESLTVARVMGQDVEVPPLLPIAGSVWPAEETPRGTIGNPDAGIRPGQQQPPGLGNRTPPGYVAPPVVPGVRRGSTTPPDLLAQPEPQPDMRQPDMPPIPTQPARPPVRADGRVIPTPQGPAVTTGGGAGYSTYTNPGGGSGIAIPQGGTTTMMDADGRVRLVPTPR